MPEYMLAGKPIVASDVDAIPDSIHDGKNGLLVAVNDAVGASQAIIRLYDNPAYKQKLIEQAAKDVHNRFDVRRVAEQHSKLFIELYMQAL